MRQNNNDFREEAKTLTKLLGSLIGGEKPKVFRAFGHAEDCMCQSSVTPKVAWLVGDLDKFRKPVKGSAVPTILACPVCYSQQFEALRGVNPGVPFPVQLFSEWQMAMAALTGQKPISPSEMEPEEYEKLREMCCRYLKDYEDFDRVIGVARGIQN